LALQRQVVVIRQLLLQAEITQLAVLLQTLLALKYIRLIPVEHLQQRLVGLLDEQLSTWLLLVVVVLEVM
jgi:hypothetical protein